MTVFEMSTIDSTPANRQYFPTLSEKLTPPERKRLLLLATNTLVDKYVDLSLGCDDESIKKKASCRRSSKRSRTKGYGRSTGASGNDEGEKPDGVLEYASEVLTLGLFLMEFVDSIREGDGDRICRCWQFFLLIFKETGRKNYAIEAFTLLAQLNFTFSPRMAAQLKWSRTINVHGRPGRNVPCDLHMEHLNRTLKGSISSLGANITDKSIQRIGRSLGKVTKIEQAFDAQNGISMDSGKHPRKSEQEDLTKIMDHLNNAQVFSRQPGREHPHFPNFTANPFKKLSFETLKVWMQQQAKHLI